MERSDVLGGDQPPRAEATPPSAPPESDTVIGEVQETPRVSVSAAMAEDATDAMGGDEGDGGSVGDDRVTGSSGAMAPRSGHEAMGQSRVASNLEERAMKAHGGDGLEKAAEASFVRQLWSDSGKDPIVEEEQKSPEIFAGNGEGAGSSRPITMVDFLETATIADLAKTLRGA